MTNIDEQYIGPDNRINPDDYKERHPSTYHMLVMLNPNPNLKGPQAVIAYLMARTALTMVENVNDGPELTAGLRKLLEAKDCFVRASLDLDPVDYRDR